MYEQKYVALAKKYVGPLAKRDSIPERVLRQAEARLGVRIPEALRVYYRVAGRAADLNQVHNRLRSPEEIVLEDDHLVFMDENQEVVS